MSEQIKQSYVGVSGVVSPEVQTSLEVIAEKVGLTEKGRILALGVKAVHKTQFLDIENKYGPEWYPVGENSFKHALRHDNPNPHTIAVAQTYLDVEHVDNAEYRKSFVARIHDRGAPWLQGIQFDMLPWHTNTDTLDFLENVKSSYGLEIFLQAHKDAMADLGPHGIVKRLGAYAHVLDYLLFDASHGTGQRLDTAALTPFIAEAYNKLDPTQTGIAIAGGLNQQAVREDLPQLIEKYPNLSWDAEGNLHPIRETGKRPLDIPTTRDYLQASSEILTTPR
jgi:hypothetical protein